MNLFVLHLRERAVGGPVISGRLYKFVDGREVSWDHRLPDFTSATAGQRLTVLIHGYNNDRDTGRERLTRFAGMLAQRGSADVMMAVLWPGDGVAKALTYPFEGRDADDTAQALFKWLQANAAASALISFVGHSLGCRVVMNTAQKLAQGGAKKFKLDRICLMAPAIDNDSLGRNGKTSYRDGTLAADRVAVLASEQDLVLRFAYPLGDVLQTIFFRERTRWALGRTGPREDAPDIRAKLEPVPLADPSWDVDHGDYLDVAGAAPTGTIAASDAFVAGFFDRSPGGRWPAQRP